MVEQLRAFILLLCALQSKREDIFEENLCLRSAHFTIRLLTLLCKDVAYQAVDQLLLEVSEVISDHGEKKLKLRNMPSIQEHGKLLGGEKFMMLAEVQLPKFLILFPLCLKFVPLKGHQVILVQQLHQEVHVSNNTSYV